MFGIERRGMNLGTVRQFVRGSIYLRYIDTALDANIVS